MKAAQRIATNYRKPVAPPVLDGVSAAATGSPGNPLVSSSLTTTGPGMVCVLVFHGEINQQSSVASITGGGLTFAQRFSELRTYNPGPNVYWGYVDLWWAMSSSALSAQTFSVTWGTYSPQSAIVWAFGVSGSNLAFDSNASLPYNTYATSSTPVSTSSPVAPLIIAAYAVSADTLLATPMVPAWMTEKDRNSNSLIDGQWGIGNAPAPLSSTAVGWTSGANYDGILVVDAIVTS